MNTVLPTPRRALIELDARRRRLLADAGGRVLDVGERGVRALDTLAAGGEQFDTIVSVGMISTAPDAGAACRQLASLLAPSGRLLFLEPTTRAGAVGLVQHAFGPWIRRTTGRRPDLDIPALLRAAGLVMSDCDRFEARALWPYRSFVEGVARPRVVSEDAS
ncbi:MAG TPA: hypothetical protein VGZ52_04335 [Acidimicrobiales bacterium]|jgi:SAM-dependent methyltransferase|nr:hypothetical protein [Acidimicrobiales bacterium]